MYNSTNILFIIDNQNNYNYMSFSITNYTYWLTELYICIVIITNYTIVIIIIIIIIYNNYSYKCQKIFLSQSFTFFTLLHI